MNREIEWFLSRPAAVRELSLKRSFHALRDPETHMLDAIGSLIHLVLELFVLAVRGLWKLHCWLRRRFSGSAKTAGSDPDRAESLSVTDSPS